MSTTQTVTLNNGIKMPIFGLGTWQSAPNEVSTAVEHALKNGYKHIDTATIYGNEHEVGKGIKDSGVDRKDIFVTTKLWNSMHDPKDVPIALERSLNSLGLDYIDLYLMHYPCANDRKLFEEEGKNVYVDIDYVDTWKAMEKLLDTGKVKAIGISNFCQSELEKLLSTCNTIPQVHQMEMHPYLKQDEFLKFHNEKNIHVTAYSPFGNQNSCYELQGEPKILEHPKVVALSEKLKVSPGNILISWAIKRGTSVIPKSVNPTRIDENIKGEALKLTAEEYDLIADLGYSKRYSDFGPYVGYWYYKDLECPGKKSL